MRQHRRLARSARVHRQRGSARSHDRYRRSHRHRHLHRSPRQGGRVGLRNRILAQRLMRLSKSKLDRKGERPMKWFYPLAILGLLVLGATAASADSADSAGGNDFAGTYLASLPTRSEILQIHADGTAEITLSDQVTSGAGGLTFSDSLGSWKVAGPRRLT